MVQGLRRGYWRSARGTRGAGRAGITCSAVAAGGAVTTPVGMVVGAAAGGAASGAE